MQTSPEEQWLVHRKPELALVPEQMWQAVSVKLKARGHHGRRAHARPLANPLGGLVRCADCGALMVGMRRDQKYQIYACASHFRNRKCNSNTVRQEALLRVTTDIIIERLFYGGNWDNFRAAIDDHVARRPECKARDLDQLKRQLDAARNQHQRAAQNLLLAEPENAPALNAAMTDLRQQVRDLESELNSVQAPLDPKSIAAEAVEHAKRLMAKLIDSDHQE